MRSLTAAPSRGNVQIGAGSETIRVDLEAERANVSKQAYVAEEVDVSKRQVSENQTVTEQLRREEVDVRETGNVNVRGDEARFENRDRDSNKR
jgi:uncharacterized protein (TIGR02271 family)